VLSIADGGKLQIHRFSLPENAVVPPSFADGGPQLMSKNPSPQSSMASPFPIFYNTALSSIFPIIRHGRISCLVHFISAS
jgi:hypothetical protein